MMKKKIKRKKFEKLFKLNVNVLEILKSNL